MTDQRADKQHTGIDNTVDTSKVLKNKEDTPARACYTPIDPKPASPQIGDGKMKLRRQFLRRL